MRNFHNFLDNPRDNNDFFYNLFNFNNFRDLNHLLNQFIDINSNLFDSFNSFSDWNNIINFNLDRYFFMNVMDDRFFYFHKFCFFNWNTNLASYFIWFLNFSFFNNNFGDSLGDNPNNFLNNWNFNFFNYFLNNFLFKIDRLFNLFNYFNNLWNLNKFLFNNFNFLNLFNNCSNFNNFFNNLRLDFQIFYNIDEFNNFFFLNSYRRNSFLNVIDNLSCSNNLSFFDWNLNFPFNFNRYFNPYITRYDFFNNFVSRNNFFNSMNRWRNKDLFNNFNWIWSWLRNINYFFNNNWLFYFNYFFNDNIFVNNFWNFNNFFN